MRIKSILWSGVCLSLLFSIGIPIDHSLAAGPSAKLIATGFDQPILLLAPPGDTDRLFIVERTGTIKIIKQGALLPTPFLDIGALIATNGERGVLGLAFHPEYASNRTLLITYANTAGEFVMARHFADSLNPDLADFSSGKVVLVEPHPTEIHYGGMLAFNPIDSHLYVALGDGGPAGDPDKHAQNPLNRLGKMLRFSWLADTLVIPADNPFLGRIDTLPEIWAMGFRNPWRWSFDRVTGDLYIGDVGQGHWEEIDYQTFSAPGGVNFGWPYKEGTHCHVPADSCDTLTGLQDPVHEYDHAGGCAVIGGYVYRGCAMPEMAGRYFFADFCSADLFSSQMVNDSMTDVVKYPGQFDPYLVVLTSLGEDARGELYVIAIQGQIFKLVPSGLTALCGACCSGIRGNVSGDVAESVDIEDLGLYVDFLFFDQQLNACADEANVDASPDDAVDISDLNAMVDYLFFNSTLPACP